MLQSLNPLQDENSQPYSVGIRQGLDTGKRFAGNAANTPLGKPAGLSSARKALGNITNRSTFQHDNATPFKATPAMPGPRSSGQQLEAGRQLRDLTDAKTKAAYVASLPAFQPPAMRRSRGVFDMLSSVDLEVLEPPPSPTSLHPSTDDLLEFQSPSSILAEISSGDLDVLSDLESDDNCEQDDCNRSWDSS
ncbi:hypothetical protein WJX79_008337 [Trebouxia sp. C0005]